MKIAVDVRTMGSRPSGIGMYIFNFLCELSGYPDLELILISDVDTSEQMKEMKKRNIPVYLYGKKVFRSVGVFGYFSFVQRTLLEIRPDFFWEPNNLLPKKLKDFGGKTILTVHDIFPISTPQYFGRLYRIYFRVMFGRSLKEADAVLYDSEFSRQEVEHIYPYAKNKNTFLSYVIIRQHDNKPEDLSKLTSDTPYFLYVGNIEQRKGSDLLLKAYEKYYEEGGRNRLIMGGGIKDDNLKAMIEASRKRTGNVEYAGYLSDEQKAAYICGCCAFIFPTKAEGFGMPIIEVMEYNRPIIARRLPIFGELIGDCIGYFDIDEDEKKEIESLSQLMHQAEAGKAEVDVGAYQKTLDRYGAGVLGTKLADYLREL